MSGVLIAGATVYLAALAQLGLHSDDRLVLENIRPRLITGGA